MSDHEPTDDALYRDPDLAQFYDLENRWGPDLDYCQQLAADAGSVLDLGCGTGQLAASLATSSRPDDYDLVITDQTMPRITGLELAAELNDIRTDLPLILATGFSDAEVSASIGKDNVRVLLRKPFSPAELGQAAQAAMRPEGTSAQ